MAPDDSALAPAPPAAPGPKLAGLAWGAIGLGLTALAVLYGADHALTSGAARKLAPEWARSGPIGTWDPDYTNAPIGFALVLGAGGIVCAIWQRRASSDRRMRQLALLGLLLSVLAAPAAVAFYLHFVLTETSFN